VLGKRRDPQSVLALTAHVRDPHKEVRRALLEALDQIGDDVAAGGVAQFTRDSELELQQAAVASLARIGSPMAIGFLGELFNHPAAPVRQEAIRILRDVGWLNPVLSARHLAMFVHDPVSELQAMAIDAAGATGHADAISGLVALAGSQEARVRLQAVSALSRVRDNQAVAALDRFRADPDDEVRRGVYRGLARVGGPQGYSLLLEGADDHKEPVRVAAIEAMGELRLGMAVPKLMTRLPRAGIVEQKVILEALGVIRSDAATEALVEVAANGGVWQKVITKKVMDRKQQTAQEVRDAIERSKEPLIQVTLEPPPQPEGMWPSHEELE